MSQKEGGLIGYRAFHIEIMTRYEIMGDELSTCETQATRGEIKQQLVPAPRCTGGKKTFSQPKVVGVALFFSSSHTP